MIIFPATLSPESRGEFWRYLGETFQMYLKARVPAAKARQFAIADTNKLIEGYHG